MAMALDQVTVKKTGAESIIGASLSEPHIDEFAVNFLYICIVRRAVNHFLVVFCVFLRHALFPT